MHLFWENDHLPQKHITNPATKYPMGGVGGRGKGCRTCVRRHVKCDEGKPTCNRCFKSKLHCQGYKEQSFISFESSESGLQRIDSRKSSSSGSSRQSTPSSRIPTPINLEVASWYSDALCISYARANLPSQCDDDSYWSIISSNDLTRKGAIEHNLVQCTFLSLARTLFAYRFNIEGLLEEGFRLYRQVLAAVHRALSLPTVPQRHEILQCILALRAFESFIPFHPGAWLQHSFGLEQVLKIQGPEAYQDAASRKHVAIAKALVTLAAIHQKRPTTLSSAKWKDTWCTLEADSASLIDVFADLPNILYGRQEDLVTDNLSEANETTTSRALELIQDLVLWRRKWNMPNPASCFPTTENWPKSISPPPWLMSGLSYETPKQAKQVLMWDAIVLISIMKALPRTIQWSHSHEHDTTCSEDIASLISQLDEATLIRLMPVTEAGLLRLFHLALSEACRSIHYYFNQDMQQDHPVDMLIPLRHVWLMTRDIACPMSLWLCQTIKQLAKIAPEGLSVIDGPHGPPKHVKALS